MSYKYSNIVGKIVDSSGSLSKGLNQGKTEAAKIIYEPNVKFPKVSPAFVKPSTGFGELDPGLLAKYKKFQVDDGVPIHLKGGSADRVLYYTTLVLCGVGLTGCFHYVYEAAFPPKAE